MIQEAEQKKMSENDSNTPPTNFEGAFANLETAFLEAAARPDITEETRNEVVAIPRIQLAAAVAAKSIAVSLAFFHA